MKAFIIQGIAHADEQAMAQLVQVRQELSAASVGLQNQTET